MINSGSSNILGKIPTKGINFHRFEKYSDLEWFFWNYIYFPLMRRNTDGKVNKGTNGGVSREREIKKPAGH